MSEHEFRHESLQDRESIVKHLQALIDGFKSGRLRLGSGAEEIVLEPDGLLDLEVAARHKDRKMRLMLRITWSTTPGDPNPRLVIRPDETE